MCNEIEDLVKMTKNAQMNHQIKVCLHGSSPFRYTMSIVPSCSSINAPTSLSPAFKPKADLSSSLLACPSSDSETTLHRLPCAEARQPLQFSFFFVLSSLTPSPWQIPLFGFLCLQISRWLKWACSHAYSSMCWMHMLWCVCYDW